MTAATGSPDQRAAADFLTLLDAEADSFTFQTFDDDKGRKRKSLAKVINGQLLDVWPQLVKLHAQGAGVFVTVNETDGSGRKLSNIKHARAVWVEDDEGTGKPLPIDPHIVVQSSPGRFHRYLLVDDIDLDTARRIQQRLVQDYGSDKAAADPARVLRLPGFYNRKVDAAKGRTGEPYMVRIVEASQALPYSAEQIIAAIPPIKVNGSRPGARAQHQGRSPGGDLPADVVADLRSALGAISSDDRGTWVDVAHALVHYKVGRELWEAWSKQSDKYDEADADRVWLSVDRSNAKRYKSVFALAQALGWRNPKTAVHDGPSFLNPAVSNSEYAEEPPLDDPAPVDTLPAFPPFYLPCPACSDSFRTQSTTG